MASTTIAADTLESAFITPTYKNSQQWGPHRPTGLRRSKSAGGINRSLAMTTRNGSLALRRPNRPIEPVPALPSQWTFMGDTLTQADALDFAELSSSPQSAKWPHQNNPLSPKDAKRYLLPQRKASLAARVERPTIDRQLGHELSLLFSPAELSPRFLLTSSTSGVSDSKETEAAPEQHSRSDAAVSASTQGVQDSNADNAIVSSPASSPSAPAIETSALLPPLAAIGASHSAEAKAGKTFAPPTSSSDSESNGRSDFQFSMTSINNTEDSASLATLSAASCKRARNLHLRVETDVRSLSAPPARESLTEPPEVPPKSPRTQSKATTHTRNNSSTSKAVLGESSRSAGPGNEQSASPTLSTLSSSKVVTTNSGLTGYNSSASSGHDNRNAPESSVYATTLQSPLRPRGVRRMRGNRSIDVPLAERLHLFTAEAGDETRVTVNDSFSPTPHPSDAYSMSRTKASQNRRLSLTVQTQLVSAHGYGTARQPLRIPDRELNRLQAHARKEAARFGILSEQRLRDMITEAEDLRQRSDAFRSAVAELRTSYKGAIERIRSHLQRPEGTALSQEHLLKHQLAAAELGASLEECIAQKEHEDTRRNHIRGRLLEHTSAVLLHMYATPSQPQRQELNEVTPPSSPVELANLAEAGEEGLLDGTDGDSNTESICIYADKDLAKLLEALKHE